MQSSASAPNDDFFMAKPDGSGAGPRTESGSRRAEIALAIQRGPLARGMERGAALLAGGVASSASREGVGMRTANGGLVARRRPKAKLFEASTFLPFVGETADPWIFLVLSALVAVTVAGVALPHVVFPRDRDARSHVIQVAGGLLVVLGAYFTAVNIREVRAQQAFERLCKVIEQLGDPSEHVRIGSVRLRESIALEDLDLTSGSMGDVRRARRNAIRDALVSVAGDQHKRGSADAARQVLLRLEQRGIL